MKDRLQMMSTGWCLFGWFLRYGPWVENRWSRRSRGHDGPTFFSIWTLKISTLGYSLLWPPTSNFLTFWLGLSVIPVQRTGVAFFSPPGVLLDSRWKLWSSWYFTIIRGSWHFRIQFLFTHKRLKSILPSLFKQATVYDAVISRGPVRLDSIFPADVVAGIRVRSTKPVLPRSADNRIYIFTFLPVQSTPKCWAFNPHLGTRWSTHETVISPTCPLSGDFIQPTEYFTTSPAWSDLAPSITLQSPLGSVFVYSNRMLRDQVDSSKLTSQIRVGVAPCQLSHWAHSAC